MFMRKAFAIAAAIAVANEFKADAVLLKAGANGEISVPVSPTQEPVKGKDLEGALTKTVDETSIDLSSVAEDEVVDVPRKPRAKKAGLCTRARNFVAEHKGLTMMMFVAAFMIVYFVFFNGSDTDPTPTTTTSAPFGTATSSPSDPLDIEAITTDVLTRLAPEQTKFNDFYSQENFVTAVSSILAASGTAWRSTAEVQTNLAAVIANYRKETGDGAHCKEVIDLDAQNAYTSGRAKEQGFFTTTCGDLHAPTNGCKGPKHSPESPQMFTEEDAAMCYYGRGPFQLSWPANYKKMQGWLEDSGIEGVDLCNNPDAVCEDPLLAMRTMILFWSNEVMSNGDLAKQFCDASGICDFSRSINGIGPENNAGNQARVGYFTDMLDTLGLPYQRTTNGSVRGGVQFDQITVDTNQAATGPEAPVSSTAAPASNAAAPEDGSNAAQAFQAAARECFENGEGCNSDHCPAGQTPFLDMRRSDGVPCACGKTWNEANTNGQPCAKPNACEDPSLSPFANTPSPGQCRCGSDWFSAKTNGVECSIYQRPSGSGRRLRGGH